MSGRSIDGERPSRVPAVVAALAVAGLLWPLTSAAISGGSLVFPSRIATYSWFTPMLEPSRIDAAAMVYQNGVGVEFLDVPQAVVLGADGATYRRLGAAEERSVAADQGDPADSVLAADGTFVVISAPGQEGSVEVLDLRTLESRTVPVPGARSAVALSIDSAGGTALLLTSDDDMSRYSRLDFALSGTLTTLDLSSGAARTLELEPRSGNRPPDARSGALSPDGRRVAAETEDALVILDAADGAVLRELAPLSGALDGDAWSPGGDRLAAVDAAGLRLIDLAGGAAVERTLPLPEDRWSSMLGWRDERTALLHLSTVDGSNDSEFAWLDVETGALDSFAAYPADPLTGAALGSADAARDLVAEWTVVDAPAGPPLTGVHVLLFSVLTGLVVRAVTVARTRPRWGGRGA